MKGLELLGKMNNKEKIIKIHTGQEDKEQIQGWEMKAGDKIKIYGNFQSKLLSLNYYEQKMLKCMLEQQQSQNEKL